MAIKLTTSFVLAAFLLPAFASPNPPFGFHCPPCHGHHYHHSDSSLSPSLTTKTSSDSFSFSTSDPLTSESLSYYSISYSTPSDSFSYPSSDSFSFSTSHPLTSESLSYSISYATPSDSSESESSATETSTSEVITASPLKRNLEEINSYLSSFFHEHSHTYSFPSEFSSFSLPSEFSSISLSFPTELPSDFSFFSHPSHRPSELSSLSFPTSLPSESISFSTEIDISLGLTVTDSGILSSSTSGLFPKRQEDSSSFSLSIPSEISISLDPSATHLSSYSEGDLFSEIDSILEGIFSEVTNSHSTHHSSHTGSFSHFSGSLDTTLLGTPTHSSFDLSFLSEPTGSHSHSVSDGTTISLGLGLARREYNQEELEHLFCHCPN